ncbi:alpha/beta hydrolase family protein [Paenibacillus peoriae]|uniref:alpha/beta hydrolase family protein n=1 Tax=Paenibacillus peoriae TaxID=59893 RepID=UPI0009701141|nr:acetylhydrolase [Paenibacillus peoriae]OMF51311.1 acetylhydrolase [Paenibacillus peoriae]
MRFLEMCYIIMNIFMLGWFLFAPKKSPRRLWAGVGLLILFLLAHGLIEGLRWPMIPAYLMTLFFVVWIAVHRRALSHWVRNALITTLAAFYAVITVASPLLFPVFAFEKPTGPYPIGTVSYHWTDDTREETFTSAPGDKRELMVQIWYPASSTSKGSIAPYLLHSDVYAQALHNVLHLPKLLFTNLEFVKTHSVEKAPLSDAEGKYPVLVFSHGLHGYKNQNTFQVEQLASHGYIVVGIDHTNNSVASVFPDGHIANFESQGKEGFEQLQFTHMDKLNQGWVKDASFVVDQIEKLSKHDPDQRFTGRMDLERIGMFGHSFGGATTVQMLMNDPRIKVGINMDGVLYGQQRIPIDGLNKPFLMMSAEDTLNGATTLSDAYIASMGTDRTHVTNYYKEVDARYYSVAAGGNYWLKLKQAKHLSFSDMYLISPLFEWMEGVDVRSTHRLINTYTLDFFNHYLKQQPFERIEQDIGDHPDFTLEKG